MFVANRGATGISARWSGEGSASTLSIDRHAVAIRYGELVRLVASDLLQAPELGALESKLSAALSCKAIVDAVVGGGSGLKISVAGWAHTIDRGDLEQICGSAVSLVEQKALGQFDLDTPVEVGGSVLWSRAPDSEAASITLQSGADFGGVVSVVPDAFAPKVDVTFTARSR